MTSLIYSNQDIPLKKSIPINLWVALFVGLQVLILLCGYFLKKAGAGGSFAPLYTRLIANSALLICSLLLLAGQGVSFRDRLIEYKKNAVRDLLVSFVLAGAAFGLAALMAHFNVLGRAGAVNTVVLTDLFSGSGGGSSFAGLGLIFLSYCMITPVMEEVFYRRLLYVSLRQKYGLLKSLTIGSLIFGLLHPDAVLFSILFGLILCGAYERFGRVRINILTHVIYNSAIIITYAKSV